MDEILNNLVKLHPGMFIYDDNVDSYHVVDFPSLLCENDDGTSVILEIFIDNDQMAFDKEYMISDPNGFPNGLLQDVYNIRTYSFFETQMLKSGFKRIDLFKEFSYKLRHNLPSMLSWFNPDERDPNKDPKMDDLSIELQKEIDKLNARIKENKDNE